MSATFTYSNESNREEALAGARDFQVEHGGWIIDHGDCFVATDDEGWAVDLVLCMVGESRALANAVVGHVGLEAHGWLIDSECARSVAETVSQGRTEANDADRAEVEALIERSKRHDEIVSSKWTAPLEDALIMRCDDSAYNGNESQYWGDDEDGNDWRVHLVKPESAA